MIRWALRGFLMMSFHKAREGLYRFFFFDGKTRSRFSAPVNIAIAIALFAGIFLLSLRNLGVTLDFGVLSEYKIRIGKGFILTIELSLMSLLLSLAVGFVSALGSRSRFLPLSYFCKVYVQFIRGTPLIMQIYLFFYVIGTAWGVTNRFWAGVIILSIFEGAYISEIIRAGLNSIDATQLEAADAVGLSHGQAMRFVILPQLMTRTLPPLTGQFASIIKDSSLLSIISVIELTQTFREISATNFALFECYFFLGLLYLCLTLPLTFFTRWLERRYKYEN